MEPRGALSWRQSHRAAPFGPGVCCQCTGRSTVRRAALGEPSCGLAGFCFRLLGVAVCGAGLAVSALSCPAVPRGCRVPAAACEDPVVLPEDFACSVNCTNVQLPLSDFGSGRTVYTGRKWPMHDWFRQAFCDSAVEMFVGRSWRSGVQCWRTVVAHFRASRSPGVAGFSQASRGCGLVAVTQT